MIQRKFKMTRIRGFMLAVIVVVYVMLINYYVPIDKVFNEQSCHKEFQLPTFKACKLPLSIPIVTVVCDQNNYNLYEKLREEIYSQIDRQIKQLSVLSGTLLYFSNCEKWRIIIITDTQKTFDEITKSLGKKWPKYQQDRLVLERRPIEMTELPDAKSLLRHYRPCAWQKIFLDRAFKDLDSIIFLDSDTLFTGPAEDLWDVFSLFNSTQAIAAAPESWYLKDGDRPYAGKVGINTGTLAMNLTRLRQMQEGGLGERIFHEFHSLTQNPRHDQDMVNIVLKKNPELLYELTFRWNFIPSDCSNYTTPCRECEKNGITIVHGADAAFFRLIDPKYIGLFNVMTNLTSDLLMSPKDAILSYESFVWGTGTFISGFICTSFKPFIPWTTFHLRRLMKQEELNML